MNNWHNHKEKKLTIIFACVVIFFAQQLFAENMVGNQSQNEGILVLPAPQKVTIDGDLKDWDLSGRIWIFADKSVRDRYSVKISAMWDEDHLYLAARWNDPTPMHSIVDPDINPEHGWRSDAWQIRMLTDHKLHLTTWYFTNKKMPLMHVSHDEKGRGGDVLRGVDGVNLGRGIQMAYRQTSDTSFAQEIKIPWKELYHNVPDTKDGLVFRMGNELLWGEVTGGTENPEHRYADNMQPGVTSRLFYWVKDKAWGDAKLVKEGKVKKLRYISEGAQPKGIIPVRVSLPLDATKFTIALNDAEGYRVRNLIADSDPQDFEVQQKDGQRIVEVKWDGLDDEGKLVKPGNYQIAGLTHTGIDPIYEMSYYNPGSPVWKTADGKGAWGSDHANPKGVARAGDVIVVYYGNAEGGYGMFAMDSEGNKKWSEGRGAKHVVADANYVYAIAEEHHKHQYILNRYRSADGAYMPYVQDGKTLKFDLLLKNILGVEEIKGKDALEGIALFDGSLLIKLKGGELYEIDAKTAKLKKSFSIGDCVALAGGTHTLYGANKNSVFEIDLKNKKTRLLPMSGLENITALSLDANQNILVADMGVDQQIKAFNHQGKLVYTCGKKGGRPIRGAFDKEGLLDVSGITTDVDGTVWAAEFTPNPRRISAWSPKTGKLITQLLGPTGYSARGSWLSDDPNEAYVGPVKMKLDRDKRTYEVTEILWSPDRSKNEGFPLWGDRHWYSAPKFIDFKFGSTPERFIYSNGLYGRYQGLYRKGKRSWQPIVMFTSVKQLKIETPYLNLDEHDDKDGVIWNDLNEDASVSLDECHFIGGGIALTCGWGTTMGSDGSLFLNTRRRESYRYIPVKISSSGAPIYGPEGIKKLEVKLDNDITPLIDDKLVISLGGHKKKGGWLQAIDSEHQKVLWRYRNRYPGVHGSHQAPMPQPGLMIGPLNIIGTAKVNETIGKVLMIRGNLGSDYMFTVEDGLMIGSLFQDYRLPIAPFPDSEADLIGKNVNHFSNRGEPFNGWFGKQTDGKIRMLNGMAGQAAMVYDMRGFDSIKRFKGIQVEVSTQLLVKAEADNQSRATKSNLKAQYALTYMEQATDLASISKRWKNLPKIKVATKGSPFSGTVNLGYSDTHLFAKFVIKDTTPWVNKGKNWHSLFKTGDAVDIQLRSTKSKSKTPVEGDMRILIAPFEGSDIAVLMKPVDSTANAENNRAYTSPVFTKKFDRVERIAGARFKTTVQASLYIVEVALPIKELGLKLNKGSSLKGDVGFIVSDKTGTFNIARMYWANKNTNLVNDLPSESWLFPASYGTIKIKD